MEYRHCKQWGIKPKKKIKSFRNTGITERYRVGDHKIGSHLNYEEMVPGKPHKSGNHAWEKLLNIHIDLNDD